MVMRNCTLAEVDPFAKPLAELIKLQDCYPHLAGMGLLVWNIACNYIELLVADISLMVQRDILECVIQKKIKFIYAPRYLFDKRSQQIRAYNICKITDPASWCRAMLAHAISSGASDLHLEATVSHLNICLRYDGVLNKAPFKHQVSSKQVVNYLKVLANCDIAESRRPQDGRFSFDHKNFKADIRLNVCPTIAGEKIALRLLDKNKSINSLKNIGMCKAVLANFVLDLKQTTGLIIVTGPTGSGKTSTLYAAISTINNLERHIITIENPVEYNLAGVNQIAVDDLAGLSFSVALRASLRQDPDIILIGEIRDAKTAATAIEAALTGHLVLSTLHTRNAWQAVVRLTQLGIAPDLISNSLRCVIAQRLCRKLCQSCTGAGCEYCNSGYSGRVGVFEYLPMQSSIQAYLSGSMHVMPSFKNFFSFKAHAQELLQQKITNRRELARVFGVGALQWDDNETLTTA